MGKDHAPFEALGPVEWQNIPQDNLDQFISDIFTETQTVVESIPAPSTNTTTVGRARSKTESAVDSSHVQQAFAQRQRGSSVSQSEDLRKEWKEIKVSPKDNPLGINVYKLGSKDGRGAWFARRSLHEGLSFDKWKRGLEMEFGETMKVQGSPGSGNIRGIGADKRVESRDLDNDGKLQVYQLSAQFPGPTSPRDFVTLLLTSESSAKPADGSRPLRQFMIISKPCEHPECPPRQGIIRGYYESVELVREVPVENLAHKRSLSSADLGKEEARARSTGPGPGSDAQSEKEDLTPMAIEWLMVTRSDPGGSVPRFLIEKGTPPGICGDAGKFLKWLTAKAIQGFPSIDEEATPQNDENRQLTEDGTTSSAQTPSTASVNQAVAYQNREEDSVPSSSGLYGIIAGAIGAASSYVPASFLRSFASNSDAGSTEDDSSQVPPIKDTYRAVDEDSSDTSSVRSFASALERSATQEKSPESINESQSETSRSNQTVQQEKELKKIQERRRKLDEKVAKLEKRRTEKLEGEKEKDAATMAKLREKHEKDVAKQEEKYRREIRKLEEKREAEQRKAEERRRKAAEKEEKANLAIELEKIKAERDLARKEIEILESQVGELQAQNTMLVRKLGKLGLVEESDSTPSLSSMTKSEAKVSPQVS